MSERKFESFYERHDVRGRIGEHVMRHLREARDVQDPEEKAGIIAEIRKYADEFGPVSDEQFDWWLAAAQTQLPEEGGNQEVGLGYIFPQDILTPDESNIADVIRIPPQVRESWAARIASGEMKMIAAFEKRGRGAGRVNLTLRGSADDIVVQELGGRIPFVHGLWVNEDQMSKGIGERLMVACEEEVLRTPELPNIIGLTVEPDNHIALKLYEKLKYRQQTVAGQDTFMQLPHFAGDQPAPHMLMIKNLE